MIKTFHFFVNIMSHLNKKHFFSNPIQEDNNKNIINEINKKKFIIVSFLEGKWKSKTNYNDCLKLGKCIADMHIKTTDFKQTRENSLSIKGWENLIKSCKTKITEIQLNKFGKDVLCEIEDSFLNIVKKLVYKSSSWINSCRYFSGQHFFIKTIYLGL